MPKQFDLETMSVAMRRPDYTHAHYCEACDVPMTLCQCELYVPGWSDIADAALDSPAHGQAGEINRRIER